MRQFALAVALLLAIAVFPTHIYAETSASSAALLPQVKPLKRDDYRVVALKNIFKKYDSPLLPYAESYVLTADKYNVDWKLLPSIAGLESSFGKAYIPGTYNVYGWGSGTIYFEDWKHGIETINKAIRENYMNKWNAKNVWEIGPIYAESPTWAVRVNKFMSEINDEYIAISAQDTLKPNL